MKYITLTLATAFLMASCHFESDKDYKKSDSEISSHEAESGHGPASHRAGADSTDAPGLHSSTPHAPAANGATGLNDTAAVNAGNAVAAGVAGSSGSAGVSGNGATGNGATGTAGTSTAGSRKGRATMSDWTIDNSAKKEMDAEGIYANADVMPEYPGGKKAIQKFIEDNIQYPQEAIDEDVQGTVQITFAVDENGNVYKATSNNKALGHGLEQEALRVVQKMPKWKPGKVNGKNVKTRLSLPVVFLIS